MEAWRGHCPLCPFKSGTTRAEVLYHNSIIGKIMFYQDLLETNLLQLFGDPENSEWFSIILLWFLWSTLLINRNKRYYKFSVSMALNSFSAPLAAAPAFLNMQVVSTSFAKMLVCKPENDVILWRHKQRIFSNNDHHSPLFNTTIWKEGIQSSSRPGHHQTSARHWKKVLALSNFFENFGGKLHGLPLPGCGPAVTASYITFSFSDQY